MPRRAKADRTRSETKATEACADAVEESLRKSGLRLTMGGEPTFVPFLPEGPEWSVDALGPTKLNYARRFAARLLRDLPEGTVLIETSGKHYPLEPIPRWCLQLHWRTDGAPLWRDRSLLRTEDIATGTFGFADAQKLATSLVDRLGLKTRLLTAAEPASARPGLEGAVVVPLDHDGSRWVSDRWPARGGRLKLLSGDSWAGLRLPLHTLPERSLRRALVIEARDGWLEAFMPPLLFSPYAELLGHLEAAVASLGCGPIVLAGYLPPADARHSTLGLSADPGVIEANLPAVETWSENRRWITRVSEAATLVGLCMRKLHYNGRATGTGGAAHLCFGGPHVDENPFFIRPSFLPSILRYWQRHPALSYLFCGQYVGPSSQAPRPDESLPDAHEQLELACAGATQLGEPLDRHLFQMLFRDLLIDRGGNTHRSEISIDKLWNPGTPNGALGVIEFRAFETHPDPELLGRVGLLVRAVLARLAARPYRKPFREWGRKLHDHYFLPTVLWAELKRVIADLRRIGFAFDEEWLRPLWAYRFPELGRLATPDGEVVFRQAHEPWPMLSEQPTASATSRAVDSSMDRIEVCASPKAAARGVLLVNGVRVPLRKVSDGALAGIRYRAFYLVPALHPHIRAHAPLRFEWVDSRTQQVLAAARYHAWHPRGQSYRELPATEREAARRRAQRWEPLPTSKGWKHPLPVEPRGRAGTLTLDLRHCATEESKA